MNESTVAKLEHHRTDFQRVVGHPFDHFFCPLLYCDHQVDICEGHIVNRAFRDASRRTVIQRQDVDSFFGAMFEADWSGIQYRGKYALPEALTDRELSRHLRPRVFRDGEEIQHYVLPRGIVPPYHTPVVIEGVTKPLQFVLKADPSDAIAGADAHWEVLIERDLRLPALVSLLKAAHLTLFDLLGYRYVFSPGGRFLGYDTLGKFFLDNYGRSKEEVLKRARDHFAKLVSVVRPVMGDTSNLKGTAADHVMSFCMPRPGEIWGMIVYVRCAGYAHAVLVPTFEDAETAARYLRFLESPFPRFETRLGRFDGNQWSVSKVPKIIDWPPASLD